ncbi:MAG TPA: NAD(P)H-dependent glycerol-3-phosphate dehydrogenase [Candidatus Coprovivens excrementavium]|nr:NAD(P)H-dependent glycerol-3-phosphate dehydrogenase [Candidatus Coprovivens excrementavium]
MKIALIGTGVYGLAIALSLNKKEKNLIMWTESEERYQKYLQDGSIKDIIKDIDVPKNIKLTTSYEKAVKNAEIVFITSTAAFVGSICHEIKPYITKKTIICIASKGIENTSCSFLSDIAYEELKNRNIAIISGPSFAIDMAYNNPIGLSIASHSKKAIKAIKSVLENDTIKLRPTSDLIGVQICGSIKNVIAVAAGMLDGMNYPESTQSFLITEALNDIKNLIEALGGNPKTINSFAGVGDLLLTCTSTKSRNFTFGYVIGAGATKEEKEQHLKEHTVEGYYTLKSIYKLIKNKKIKMPIIDLIYKIVMNDEDPKQLINFLINKK